LKLRRYLLFAAAIPLCADAAGTSSALEALKRAEPKYPWTQAGALEIDMDCDGKVDHVFLLQTSTVAHVGLVLGRQQGKRVFSWTVPIGVSEQDSLCEAPASIDVESLNYKPPVEAVGPVPGFSRSKTCTAFVLSGGECDPFHFYWDHKKQRPDWWRL
jgi:hypothetical protein